MARSLLYGAMSALLLASAAGQTVIRLETWESLTSGCPAGAAISTNEFTANTCSAGTKYFCDAQNTYKVTYLSTDCAALTDVSTITQYKNGCGWRAINEQYSCVNATAGTGAYPFSSFPPTNYAVANYFYNHTDGSLMNQCLTNNPDVVAVPVASSAGCQKRTGGSQTPGSSFISTCNNDGTLSTTVVYSKDDCTGDIIHATQAPMTGCTNGVLQTCQGRPATPSSGLPTVGVYTYPNTADCNKADTSQTYTLDLYTAGCFDSHKLQCISYGNATAVADFYTYVSNTCSDATPQSEAFFNANECIVTGNTASKKYVCSVDPNPDHGNSAATNSVSLVAALFAVLATFIAGKAQ